MIVWKVVGDALTLHPRDFRSLTSDVPAPMKPQSTSIIILATRRKPQRPFLVGKGAVGVVLVRSPLCLGEPALRPDKKTFVFRLRFSFFRANEYGKYSFEMFLFKSREREIRFFSSSWLKSVWNKDFRFVFLLMLRNRKYERSIRKSFLSGHAF